MVRKPPLQRQDDSVSCGIYVFKYMQMYVDNHIYGIRFDALQFRQTILKQILVESDCLINACLYCAKISHKQKIMCSKCARYVDFECLSSKSQLSFKDWKSDQNIFICSICQLVTDNV